MPVSVRLGRLPAVADDRVPFLSTLAAAKALPPPPASADWTPDLGALGMLGNSDWGDCCEAGVGHMTQGWTAYAGDPQIPTTDQALALYSAVTGFNQAAGPPGANPTDNGTQILGAGGLMEYWAKNGVTFGSATSKAAAYAQLKSGDDALWIRQAIALFGFVPFGLNLPENVVSGDTVPQLWGNPNGPIAGGHFVVLCGYEPSATYGFLFSLISWGALYKCTLPFLRGTFEECLAVYDPDFLNAKGVDAADATGAELMTYMAAIRSA